MNRNLFSGFGIALITPFDQEGNVDHHQLSDLVRRSIDNGVDYLVALGTTAETPTLSPSERQDILKTIVKAAENKVPVIAGIGGNDTRRIIQDIKQMDLQGVSAILSVVPFYNKPSQEGLYQHFKAISTASPLPIILYNIPGRSGVNMEAKTTLRLAHDCPNCIGVKEASGNLAQVDEIIKHKPEGFFVLSGDDSLTLSILKIGGNGVISVIGNLLPDLFGRMVHLFMEGKINEAQAIEDQLQNIYKLLIKEGNPTGVKTAISILNLCRPVVRLPLIAGSEDLRLLCLEELKKLKVIS